MMRGKAGHIVAIAALTFTACEDRQQQDSSRRERRSISTQHTEVSAAPNVLESRSTEATSNKLTPTYEVVDRDIYDAPIKTQIELHAVVQEPITEPGLKQALKKLYKEATTTREFKHNGGKPTHVFIYLYTSRDHFESGMGQWIAMLSKTGEDAPIEAKAKKDVIKQLGTESEEKFGLSEAKRKEMFQASVRAEDRAVAEAEQRWPLEPTDHLTVGQTFTLSKPTPMLPGLDSADTMDEIERIRRLPAGSRITVVRIEIKRNTRWYQVQASTASGDSLGSGWIYSIALMGQSKLDTSVQLKRQAAMMSKLTERYMAEVAEQYGITEEQLRDIVVEGSMKNWPMPGIAGATK